MSSVPTLTIDVRKLMHSGIGRYLRNLLPDILPRLSAEHIQLLHFPQDRTQILPLIGQDDRVSLLETDAEPHSLAEQMLAFHPALSGTGVLWVPHYNIPVFYRGPLAVTVHDLAPLDLPENFGTGMGRIPKQTLASVLLGRVVQHASTILTVSNFTRERLIDRLHAPPERIQVTPLAVDSTWPSLGEAPEAYSSSFGPYLLFVGNLKPNKNLRVILNALLFLRERGDAVPHLVIAGKTEGFITADAASRAAASKLGSTVRLLGPVSDEELISLYRGALALIMPSLYEGFGLPLLEAMRYGCPVLCSDRASLPEVGGEAAWYFDPEDPASLAALIRGLDDSTRRERLRNAGISREGNFSWKAAETRIAEVLNRLTHSSTRRKA